MKKTIVLFLAPLLLVSGFPMLALPDGHLPKNSFKVTPDGRIWGNKNRNDSLYYPVQPMPIDSTIHDDVFEDVFD